jgi:transcriptional regulator with XRE-family HTH domain
MQLAVRAGLSLSVVSQIEQGSIPDPRVSTLLKLAAALGVTLDELAGPARKRGGK